MKGILIKSGESLERACRITALVVDKTGTITRGRPDLVEVVVFGTYTDNQALRIAGSAEKKSEHPLARAIVAKAEQQCGMLPVSSGFEAVPGRGIRCVVDGCSVRIGTIAFLGCDGAISDRAVVAIAKMEEAGQSAILMSVDGALAAVFGLADTIRPDSREAIEQLKRLGVGIHMVTGDNDRTAAAIARQAGIDNVFAGVLPHEKAQHVARLQKEGRVVGMVGDGVNDAPALVQADVGMAIGAGADVAMESADITLVHSSLSSAVHAIVLSKRVFRTIKINLFWAFAYNIVGMPIAAAGLLDPMLAGAAMALSSVSVVMNSLSLKRMRFD